MDSLFHSFPLIFTKLDDILVFNQSRAKHLGHLETVLATLAANALHINLAKCHFAQPQVEFLGHLVKATGIVPLTSHVQAILAFLASAVLLHHPHPSAKLLLATDASDTHVGAVLQQ
jgi:hypothetical protein